MRSNHLILCVHSAIAAAVVIFIAAVRGDVAVTCHREKYRLPVPVSEVRGNLNVTYNCTGATSNKVVGWTDYRYITTIGISSAGNECLVDVTLEWKEPSVQYTNSTAWLKPEFMWTPPLPCVTTRHKQNKDTLKATKVIFKNLCHEELYSIGIDFIDDSRRVATSCIMINTSLRGLNCSGTHLTTKSSPTVSVKASTIAAYTSWRDYRSRSTSTITSFISKAMSGSSVLTLPSTAAARLDKEENSQSGLHILTAAMSTLGIVITISAILIFGFIFYYLRKRQRKYRVTSVEAAIERDSDEDMQKSISKYRNSRLPFVNALGITPGIQSSQDTDLQTQPVSAHICHPANTRSSKKRLHQLAYKLRKRRVKCTAMFLLEDEALSQGHGAVERYMSKSDYIIVCCNKEFKSAWDKRNEPINPRYESYFSPFRLEATLIENEIADRTYRRLIVVLLDDATADCVPPALRAAPPLHYPGQLEDLLRRLHGVDEYELPMPSCTSTGI